MKKDIETKEDIELLVNKFYDKVNQDDLLSPIFNIHAKVDWSTHLPKMVTFWSGLLLDTNEYRGQPFDAHAKQKEHIYKEHFDRWISLFLATLDENFCGAKTELAKQRSQSIGAIFQYKLDFLRMNEPHS